MDKQSYEDVKLNKMHNETYLYELGGEQMEMICSETDEILLEFKDEEIPVKVHDEFQKIVSGIKREKKRKERRKTIRRVGSRVAVVLVLVLGVGSVVGLNVEAVRIRVFNMFAVDHGTHTEFVFTENEELVSPEDLSNHYFPTYMTEGYYLDEYQTCGIAEVYIFREEKHLIVFKVLRKSSSPTVLVDTEGVDVHEIDINGLSGMYVEKYGTITMLWSNEEKLFEVSGEVPLEEIVRIAESIRWFD